MSQHEITGPDFAVGDTVRFKANGVCGQVTQIHEAVNADCRYAYTWAVLPNLHDQCTHGPGKLERAW